MALLRARPSLLALAVLANLLTFGRLVVHSQGDLQVGYATLTVNPGSPTPVASALFSSTNADGVLIWEAGVAAVEPISRGRIFVDQTAGTRTAIALVNPSPDPVTATLTLRDSAGMEFSRQPEDFGAGEHKALFVDELFSGVEGFQGSLTFDAGAGELAAVTLRQNANQRGEPIFATLPVVDLSAQASTDPLIFPHIGAGEGLSTQIILINASAETASGEMQFFDDDGMPLELELDGITGSRFPYEMEPDGTFKGTLRLASGLGVGSAVATLAEGSRSPSGVAIFQFTSGSSVVSEAGVGTVETTTRARIFADQAGTSTGVAIANPGGVSQTELTFRLLTTTGNSVAKATRRLPARGHLAVFVEELFPGVSEGFTGLMEITSELPIAPVTLKLTINSRGDPILATLPLADLNRPSKARDLIFPQLGFGAFDAGEFSTRLILINPNQATGSDGTLRFSQPDGAPMVVPLSGASGSEFSFQVASGGGRELKPGAATGSVAEILINSQNPSGQEVVVNVGGTLQLEPVALDGEGRVLEGVDFGYLSLDPQVATVDAAGTIRGLKEGFSTLTVAAGGAVRTQTITVAKVTGGAAGLDNVTGVAQDLARRLYLADTANHTILLAQNIESVPEVYAGIEARPGLVDDERLKALFRNPAFLALDQARGNLYLSDAANHVIRLVKPGPIGRVETVAGTGTAGSADGSVAEASFRNPQGIALDSRGNLWVSDSDNHTIRRINLVTEVVETIAGEAGNAGLVDGAGEEARFDSPRGIAIERESLAEELNRQKTGEPPPPVSVIIADTGNNVIRRVTEGGVVGTIGLTQTPGRDGPDRPGFQQEPLVFSSPRDVAVDCAGNIYVADADRVRAILQRLLNRVDVAASKTFSEAGGIEIADCGDVIVSDRNGISSVSYAAPEIVSIVPTKVSSVGGDAVTVEGRNFAPESLVLAAGVVVADVEVKDTHTISFSAPPLPSGLTTLTVQTRGGLAQTSLFVEAIPLNELPPRHISTVAGGSTFAGDGSRGTQAEVESPRGVAIDGHGNVLFADTDHHRIRKVDAATGIITSVAGTGMKGFSGDGGPAIAADLDSPEGVVVDGAGNLVIADTRNSRIRRVDASTGTIITIAGGGSSEENGVPALEARIFWPHRVTLDGAGNLFIVQQTEDWIRKVDASTGTITTVAGGREAGFAGDGGLATEAALDGPAGMTADSSGNLFIADSRNNRIRRVDASTGIIQTVAGSGPAGFLEGGFSGDGGPATAATLDRPAGVAADSSGNLFIADSGNSRIRQVDASTGIITTVGGGECCSFEDGVPATATWLSLPDDVALDGSGNLYVSTFDDRISRLEAATGIIRSVAGIGESGVLGDGGAATAATLDRPESVIVDGKGNLYIADSGDHRVRKVDAATGIITTAAGTGEAGVSSGDGPATEIELWFPSGLAVDEAGDLFIASGNQIRRVDSTSGIITTVAGVSVFLGGFSGDGGPASEAELDEPARLALDGGGNLFISDRCNHRIRKVNLPTGIITTVAGSGPAGFGNGGFSGDGEAAAAARLDSPLGLTADSAGNLFIADSGNHRIRKVDAVTGVISTVAELTVPQGVTVDGTDHLFVARLSEVLKLDASTGVITTVAGPGMQGLLNDGGPATEADLLFASAVAVDQEGNIFIADLWDRRIRAVRGPIP